MIERIYALSFGRKVTGYAVVDRDASDSTYRVIENGIIPHALLSPRGALDWFLDKHIPDVLLYGAYDRQDMRVEILPLKRHIRFHSISKCNALSAGIKAEARVADFYRRVHAGDQVLEIAFDLYVSLQALCIACHGAFYEDRDDEKTQNLAAI